MTKKEIALAMGHVWCHACDACASCGEKPDGTGCSHNVLVPEVTAKAGAGKETVLYAAPLGATAAELPGAQPAFDVLKFEIPPPKLTTALEAQNKAYAELAAIGKKLYAEGSVMEFDTAMANVKAASVLAAEGLMTQGMMMTSFGDPKGEILALVPGLGEMYRGPCPASPPPPGWGSASSCPRASVPQRFVDVVIHLNDAHTWPREAILKWLEDSGADLAVALGEDGGRRKPDAGPGMACSQCCGITTCCGSCHGMIDQVNAKLLKDKKEMLAAAYGAGAEAGVKDPKKWSALKAFGTAAAAADDALMIQSVAAAVHDEIIMKTGGEVNTDGTDSDAGAGDGDLTGPDVGP